MPTLMTGINPERKPRKGANMKKLTLVTIYAGSNCGEIRVRESASKIHQKLKVAGANAHPSIELTDSDGRAVTLAVSYFIIAVDNPAT